MIKVFTNFKVYGKVIKLLGNCRLYVLCEDGITRLCHIRGKLKKNTWIVEVTEL